MKCGCCASENKSQPYGKVKAVRKDQANNTNSCTSLEYTDSDEEFLYTASQQRLCKIVKPHKPNGAGISDQDEWMYYWYSYDAGGNLMGVYKQSFVDLGSNSYKVKIDLQEHGVYGSGRTGMRHADDESDYYQNFTSTMTAGRFATTFSYTGNSAAYNKAHYTRTIGYKQYEVSNHLGNVLATVSDKRLLYSATPGSATQVDWYVADVQSYGDYYVFGAMQTGRAGGSYRYGFNGKENDNEINNVDGSWQDYGMRMYDPRVGRFFSADPLMFMYPYLTPYQFAENMPITSIDLDGLEAQNANGAEPQKLDNGRYEGDSNGSMKKGSVLIGTKIGGVVHKAEVKTRVASENKTGETVPRENIPSINAESLNSPEGNKDVKIHEPSAAQEFGDGFKESLYSTMYGIADHGPMYIVDGAVNTFWALGDVFNDGIAYWSTPRSGPGAVTYILDDRNYTNTSKSIIHATPRAYGRFFGGVAISAASGSWLGGVSRLNGGRYFPNFGVAVEEGVTGAKVNAVKSSNSLVQTNRTAGNLFRDELAEALKAEGRTVRTEVYKRTPFGKRFLDIEVSVNGVVQGGIEAKVGGSPYTAMQRLKDGWLSANGYPVQLVRKPTNW